MMKKLLSITLFLLTFSFLFCDVHVSTQPHTGQINDMIITEDSIFTVGDDGYVINWREDGEGEHYQISDLEIKLIAKNPANSNIAIYETDGYSVNKVSVWDWSTQTKLYPAKIFNDTVSSLQFTENGNYLMVGTKGEEGLYFLDSKGDPVAKLEKSVKMVNFAASSATEKSCILYSPTGHLDYYNLQTRAKKAEITVEANLEQPVLFSNDLLFAGVKNGTIYIFNSMTGSVLTKIQAKNPVLATGRNDSNLYYIDGDSSNYTLRMVQADKAKVLSKPLLLKNIVTRGKSEITALTKNDTTLYAACKDGTVHLIDMDVSTEICQMEEASKQVYSRIYDIACVDDTFFFLTDTSVFTSSYTDMEIMPVTSNKKYTNLLTKDEDSIIFWSENTTNPITYATAAGNWYSRVIYTPSKTLQDVKIFGNKLIIIEGNNTVKMYDFSTGKIKTLFTGTGIQDALLFSDDVLYVAKTASSEPKASLIQVDVQTLETVALPVTGEVSFGLSRGADGSNVFYGVNFSEADKQSQIFAFYPSNKQYSTISTWKEEDTEAFTRFNNGILYTNIGKDKIYNINIRTRKWFTYQRFASLPVKVTGNNNLLLVLNKDGSVSWYNAKSNTMYSTWYITLDGEWVSF